MPIRLDQIEGSQPQQGQGLPPEIQKLVGQAPPQDRNNVQTRAVNAQISQNIKSAAPSATEEQTTQSQENFANLLNRLRQSYGKAQTVERGPMALASGAKRSVAAAMQLDPEVSTYSGLRKATLGQAARVISTEKGVMTNQDMQRIEAAIPTQFTAKETGNQQFDQLEGITIDVVKNSINKGRKQRGEPEVSDDEVRQHLGLAAKAGVTPSGLKYTIED